MDRRRTAAVLGILALSAFLMSLSIIARAQTGGLQSGEEAPQLEDGDGTLEPGEQATNAAGTAETQAVGLEGIEARVQEALGRCGESAGLTEAVGRAVTEAWQKSMAGMDGLSLSRVDTAPVADWAASTLKIDESIAGLKAGSGVSISGVQAGESAGGLQTGESSTLSAGRAEATRSLASFDTGGSKGSIEDVEALYSEIDAKDCESLKLLAAQLTKVKELQTTMDGMRQKCKEYQGRLASGACEAGECADLMKQCSDTSATESLAQEVDKLFAMINERQQAVEAAKSGIDTKFGKGTAQGNFWASCGDSPSPFCCGVQAASGCGCGDQGSCPLDAGPQLKAVADGVQCDDGSNYSIYVDGKPVELPASAAQIIGTEGNHTVELRCGDAKEPVKSFDICYCQGDGMQCSESACKDAWKDCVQEGYAEAALGAEAVVSVTNVGGDVYEIATASGSSYRMPGNGFRMAAVKLEAATPKETWAGIQNADRLKQPLETCSPLELAKGGEKGTVIAVAGTSAVAALPWQGVQLPSVGEAAEAAGAVAAGASRVISAVTSSASDAIGAVAASGAPMTFMAAANVVVAAGYLGRASSAVCPFVREDVASAVASAKVGACSLTGTAGESWLTASGIVEPISQEAQAVLSRAQAAESGTAQPGTPQAGNAGTAGTPEEPGKLPSNKEKPGTLILNGPDGKFKLETKNLAAVHCTPTWPENGVVQPKAYYEDTNRFTVHYYLNDGVPSHIGNDWTGDKIAIITPVDDIMDEVVNLNLADTYTFGPSKLSDRSVVLVQESAYKPGMTAGPARIKIIPDIDPVKNPTGMREAIRTELKGMGYTTAKGTPEYWNGVSADGRIYGDNVIGRSLENGKPATITEDVTDNSGFWSSESNRLAQETRKYVPGVHAKSCFGGMEDEGNICNSLLSGKSLDKSPQEAIDALTERYIEVSNSIDISVPSQRETFSQLSKRVEDITTRMENKFGVKPSAPLAEKLSGVASRLETISQEAFLLTETADKKAADVLKGMIKERDGAVITDNELEEMVRQAYRKAGVEDFQLPPNSESSPNTFNRFMLGTPDVTAGLNENRFNVLPASWFSPGQRGQKVGSIYSTGASAEIKTVADFTAKYGHPPVYLRVIDQTKSIYYDNFIDEWSTTYSRWGDACGRNIRNLVLDKIDDRFVEVRDMISQTGASLGNLGGYEQPLIGKVRQVTYIVDRQLTESFAEMGGLNALANDKPFWEALQSYVGRYPVGGETAETLKKFYGQKPLGPEIRKLLPYVLNVDESLATDPEALAVLKSVKECINVNIPEAVTEAQMIAKAASGKILPVGETLKALSGVEEWYGLLGKASSRLGEGAEVVKSSSLSGEQLVYKIDEATLDWVRQTRARLGIQPGEVPTKEIENALRPPSGTGAGSKMLSLFEQKGVANSNKRVVFFSEVLNQGEGECVERSILAQLFAQEGRESYLVQGEIIPPGDVSSFHTFNVIYKRGEPYLVDTANSNPGGAPFIVRVEGIASDGEVVLPEGQALGRIYYAFDKGQAPAILSSIPTIAPAVFALTGQLADVDTDLGTNNEDLAVWEAQTIKLKKETMGKVNQVNLIAAVSMGVSCLAGPEALTLATVLNFMKLPTDAVQLEALAQQWRDAKEALKETRSSRLDMLNSKLQMEERLASLEGGNWQLQASETKVEIEYQQIEIALQTTADNVDRLNALLADIGNVMTYFSESPQDLTVTRRPRPTTELMNVNIIEVTKMEGETKAELKRQNAIRSDLVKLEAGTKKQLDKLSASFEALPEGASGF